MTEHSLQRPQPKLVEIIYSWKLIFGKIKNFRQQMAEQSVQKPQPKLVKII
jgi:hypothetical protein